MFVPAKYFWLLSICFLLLSCHWKNKKTTDIDKHKEKTKDTTHLINFIKSAEPKIYKGTVPRAFYNNRGAFDFWRYPLVYPYSIGCIDVRDYGRIYSDKDKTNYDAGGSIQSLTDYFDKFTFDKSYFVASKCKSPFDNETVKVIEKYFVFSFVEGTTKNIQGGDNLKREFQNIKFTGDTAFMTIREYGEKL